MLYELLRLHLRLDRRLDEYKTKFEIFKNNIYGVDIDPIAIEISKLRSFLSLIVDQEYNDKKINGGIDPLPNLEFKFVCANTLISPSLINSLFDDSLIFFNKLNKIKEQYFKANLSQRLNLEQEWKNATIIHPTDGEKIITLKSYKPFDSNNSAQFYYPILMHDVEDNFDIVIGNPPYIQLQKNNGQLANLYQNSGFKTFERSGDIYCLFYEKGINLLKKEGILAYITSNK